MQVVAHEGSSPGLFPGHVDHVSIQRAHDDDRHHDARQHPQEHKMSVLGFEAWATEEPRLTVGIAAEPQQGQGGVQQAEQPDQDEHRSTPPGCPDAAVAEGEADLCELIHSGPGERLNGGGLQEEEHKAAGLTEGTVAGETFRPGEAVARSHR